MIQEVSASNRQQFRNWLAKNGTREIGVWLLIYKKNSGIESVTYEEAVEEALCFGWIDSKPNKRDEKSYVQYFAKRKPSSKWSAINKKRVKKLIAAGLMTDLGMQIIELAKKSGTWTALDKVSKLVIPPDLKSELQKQKATKNFSAFPPSTIRGILEWIDNAKRSDTRAKRIMETALLAAKGERANQFPRVK